jgi:hypothetical protein
VDHETAISTHAAERYALGDMTDAEAGAFEEHFFECRHCAQDVKDTVSFAEGARVVLVGAETGGDADVEVPSGERPKPAPPSVGLRVMFPAAAAAALVFLAVAVYQATVTIPELKRYAEPRTVASTLLRVVRAAPPVVTVRAGQPTFELEVDVNAPEPAPRYRLDFRSLDGKPVAVVEAEAPETGTLQVILPAVSFPAGEYTMGLSTIDAGKQAGEMMEEYRFRVEVNSE